MKKLVLVIVLILIASSAYAEKQYQLVKYFSGDSSVSTRTSDYFRTATHPFAVGYRITSLDNNGGVAIVLVCKKANDDPVFMTSIVAGKSGLDYTYSYPSDYYIQVTGFNVKYEIAIYNVYEKKK